MTATTSQQPQTTLNNVEPMEEDGIDVNTEIQPENIGKSLTKPDVSAHGLQFDNENFDLILHVGDLLGSGEETGEYTF